MRQLALPVRLRASSVFASYYAGPNADAVAQLRAIAPGQRGAVCVFGPTGVGKTHLLQALCAHAGAQNHAAGYFPLRELGPAADVLDGCESLDLVCLDDFDAVASRAQWERAVFRLYTLLDEHGGRLVVSAPASPSQLSLVLPDLASRLAGGIVLRLQALSDDEQARALMLRAEQLGLQLPPDVAQYLLRRLPRDMTTLCDALDTLDQASLATQRRLTIPMVRQVLDGR